MSIPEHIWRKAEQDMVQREFQRKRDRGGIRPFSRFLPPTHVYKDAAGRWVAALGYYNPLEVL